MEQNISFEAGGLKISEQVISRAVTTIFPGQNYLDTLILIFVWLLVGLITMGVFFYFSKKHKMFKSMTFLEKLIFSSAFGFFSFMIIIITYLPVYFLGYDPLNFQNGTMLPFMILSGFLLYGCLKIASAKMNGRPFLIKTFTYLWDFLLVFSITFLSVSLAIKTESFFPLIGLIIVVIRIRNIKTR